MLRKKEPCVVATFATTTAAMQTEQAALFTCHTPPAGVKMHNSPMRVVHFTWGDRPQASSSVSSILRNTDTSSVLLT